MFRESIKILLKCTQCKKTLTIRVNNLKPYTKEVRDSYVCLICRSGSRVGNLTSKKKEGKMSEVMGMGMGITAVQSEEVVKKLGVPKGWKKALVAKYLAGANTVALLLVEVDALVDTKTRVKGPEEALQKMKAKIKANARKVLGGVLGIEIGE